jgi:dihydrodipicolinate synthase/N-acetylneuraminate lyase
LVKAGCELMGHPVGPPRLPLAPAPADDVTRLAEILPA